jgi:hypothetical protein
MLKSGTAYDLQMEVLALATLMLLAMTLAVRGSAGPWIS